MGLMGASKLSQIVISDLRWRSGNLVVSFRCSMMVLESGGVLLNFWSSLLNTRVMSELLER